MATVNIFQWHGTRHYCSVCNAEGIPRGCGCAGGSDGGPAHVEDWKVWLTVTDIIVRGWWPARRLERLADAERSLRL